MGRRGPKPTPSHLKLLRGSRNSNRNEPVAPSAIPRCPPELSPAAKREWKRIVPLLREMNVLSSVDRAALAGYCQAYGRWVEAEEKLQSTGLIIKSPSGYPIHNPYLDIATRAMKELRSFAVEFGLTPSARTRLNMFSQPREQHPLGKLRFFQPAGTNGA